jgi:hypothetical protein
MDSYTIEDIETLREKGGLSYQEAVAILDYHNGSLARALIDLEKSGRLKSNQEEIQEKDAKTKMSGSAKKNDTKEKALNLLQKLYRSRLKIHKGNTPIINISVLFGAACLLFAPHMTIIGIIISMILGYRFSFTKMDEAFSSDSLEKMVKSAAQNAKSSVSSVVQSFTGEKSNPVSADRDKSSKEAPKPVHAGETKKENDPFDVKEASKNLREQTAQIEETMDSFFESNPAATTYHSAYSAAASGVPTLQVPVQTETRDGEVQIEDDRDGYSSVTIG